MSAKVGTIGPVIGRREGRPGSSYCKKTQVNVHVKMFIGVYCDQKRVTLDICTWKHALCGGLSGRVEPILLTTLRVDPWGLFCQIGMTSCET